MRVLYSCEDHIRHPRLNSRIANELGCILNLNNCINFVVLLAQSLNRPNIIYFGHYPPDLTITSTRIIVVVSVFALESTKFKQLLSVFFQ